MCANLMFFLCGGRYMDAVGIGVCDSQELYFYKSAAYGCGYAEGCEDVEGVGVGYWEEETERRGKIRSGMRCIYMAGGNGMYISGLAERPC